MKTKIAIVGTGGVGGFIGGLLARHYRASEAIEIYFISRGEALQQIRSHGLIVDTQSGRFVAHPTVATDSVSEIGTMDYILLCTKAYDIERAVDEIRPAIGANTVILPFLNGVDSTEKIKAQLSDTTVWDGCVYVVAYIVKPGHIAEHTNGYRYMFGLAKGNDERLPLFEKICTDAEIRARAEEDITRRIWDKYAFISTVATATSYTDQPYGGVLDHPENRKQFMALLHEFLAVAAAKGISLSSRIASEIVTQMERISADTTTSMQRDFRAHRSTELESLTGYIVREGDRLGIDTPMYDRMYAHLKGLTR